MNLLRFLDDAWQDLRLGVRALAQTPAVSALMVATLAVGIGATTAIFSVMNVLLLRPVAGVYDQRRLVSVEHTQGPGIVDVFLVSRVPRSARARGVRRSRRIPPDPR